MKCVQPIHANERNKLIDILRGFALSGVLIANFASFIFYGLPERQVQQLTFLPGDRITAMFTGLFIDGKFITLFSMLFGYGFGVIIERLASKGIGVNAFFMKRMFMLLLIGLAHLACWYGDILSSYAVCGMLLLLFRGMNNMQLIISAAVLLLVISPVLEGVRLLVLQENKAAGEVLFTNYLQASQSGNFVSLVGYNYTLFDFLFLRTLIQYKGMAEILGCFLIGYYILRNNILEQLAGDARKLKKMQMSLLSIALVYLAATSILPDYLSDLPGKIWLAIFYPFETVGMISLALFYVITIARWFHQQKMKAVFHAMSQVGRMSLTNYLMHTLFFVFIFHGFGLGLLGKMNVQWTIPFSIAICAIQIVISSVWLKYMHYGPAEWLWRRASATYTPK